ARGQLLHGLGQLVRGVQQVAVGVERLDVRLDGKGHCGSPWDGFACSARGDVSWDARGRRQRGGGVLFLDREPDLVPVHGHAARRVDAEADARPGDLEHRDGDLVAEADALAGSSGDYEHAYTPVAATGAAGVAGRTSDSGTRANSGSRTP